MLAALLSLSATAAAQSTNDYDSDNDGYIDIDSLAKLDAIRYDMNGNGKQDSVGATDWAKYTAAFPNPATGMGCKLTDHDGNSQTADQPTCVGYELTASLDFDTNGDGSVTTSGDTYWNNGAGWSQIGTLFNRYSTTFKGNGHTINNLFINKSSSNFTGLFAFTDSSARIETLGITNANLTALGYSGILVGSHYGTIVACYTTGKIVGAGSTRERIGGLVGEINSGEISTSYSTAYVSGSQRIGGLLGYRHNGSVTNSYSTGRVNRSSGTATTIGGLIGDSRAAASGSVSNSYYDTSTSGCVTGGSDGCTTSAGGSGVVGKTTRQIQAPTGYNGIYANWNNNLDGVTGNDDPWTFGNNMQYPMLDYKMMSTTPQNSQAMGIPDNWNAPIVGERVAVCVTSATRSSRSGGWQWEKSTNGDTWTALTRNSGATYEYYPVSADVGSYLRAKAPLSGGGSHTRAH